MQQQQQQPTTPPDGELLPGDAVEARGGRFSVLYYLGGGTYGRSYRARWEVGADGGGPPIPTDVVLKQLRRREERSESETEFSERVTREALMTRHLIPSRLRNDVGVDAATICRTAISCDILQFATSADESYLVFPWMSEAETLWRFVDRRLHIAETASQTSVAERDLIMARISADLFATLTYLHRIGVIHNDVKANNFIVYLDPVDNERRVQIIDFGLACAAATFTDSERRALDRSKTAPELRQLHQHLACDKQYTQTYRLRDPLSMSRKVFPFNPTYQNRRGMLMIAFPDEPQRRRWYPIFERYATAAMLVDLYAYNEVDSLARSGSRIAITDKLPPGRWVNNPIPPATYNLILACTFSEPRASAEEALDLALKALSAADREYRMQPWRRREN